MRLELCDSMSSGIFGVELTVIPEEVMVRLPAAVAEEEEDDDDEDLEAEKGACGVVVGEARDPEEVEPAMGVVELVVAPVVAPVPFAVAFGLECEAEASDGDKTGGEVVESPPWEG